MPGNCTLHDFVPAGEQGYFSHAVDGACADKAVHA
jgi:hypothetical protein